MRTRTQLPNVLLAVLAMSACAVSTEDVESTEQAICACPLPPLVSRPSPVDCSDVVPPMSHGRPLGAGPPSGVDAPLPPQTFPTYVGDANTDAIIKQDADRFWAEHFYMTGQEEVDSIQQAFDNYNVPVWEYGSRAAALVQMFDLLEPIDPARAYVYLSRLRCIADALLVNRDDLRDPPIVDSFHGRAVAGWGAYGADRDCRWNTDVVVAGLYTYAMAAFARRVADNPSAFSEEDREAAIRFTTATVQSYFDYRDDLHLDEHDRWAYFKAPAGYATLTCSLFSCDEAEKVQKTCNAYKNGADHTIAYNENMLFMKALAELALAADSTLYRDSDDSLIHAFRIYYATYEAPVVIAKNFTFFEDHLNEKTLSDGTPYFEWSSQLGSPTKNIEDTGHASVTLGSLAVLLDDKSRLDALLEANNRTERVALSTPLFERFANTFLRIIWKYDYQDPSGLRNILSIIVDGSLASNAKNANGNCAGWIPLAQFNPWMWIRCRDATFHPGVGTANYLNVDNHAALLRYRQFR